MIKTDALIIGAGPVGLFTAHQIRLIGLSCEIVDNLDKINKKTEGEDDMLDQAYEPKKNSRLSCQIQISDDIEGLEVYLPEKQI